MKTIVKDSPGELDPRWQRYVAGAGALEPAGSAKKQLFGKTQNPARAVSRKMKDTVEVLGASLRFVNAATSSRKYTDAQIDDYQGLPRRRFPWRPPLRLTVRARFSHPTGELKGTAGFGFWNDPFMMTGARIPTLPRALWFFYGSPPSNMKLDLHTPGHGWKAASIDALRPAVLLLAPVAPLAVLLMNVRPLYRRLWPPIQRALNVREAVVEVEMTEWHTYTIEWEAERAEFRVDGKPVLEGAPAPRGPLGFVMWLDNQYMAITPWGKFRWGLLDAPGRQWMEVGRLAIETQGAPTLLFRSPRSPDRSEMG